MQNTFFIVRPDIYSVPATIDTQDEGIYFSPVEQLPELQMAYHIFYNEEGVLTQQSIPPMPYDWKAFSAELLRLGFAHITLGLNGIINTEKDSTTYRVFMGYSVIKSTSGEPVGFMPVANTTKNGYQDWIFVSKDASDPKVNWKQQLHVFSIPQNN